MKKLGLFEIRVSGELVYSVNNEDDALDKLQDLALKYYETGSPDPSTIEFIRHGETQSIPDGESIH
jgi:phosphate uptake regulator|tara:strand:- start:827 stop:1024 length:198 start_codon:yes stop_codon:yes gene_type:complete